MIGLAQVKRWEPIGWVSARHDAGGDYNRILLPLGAVLRSCQLSPAGKEVFDDQDSSGSLSLNCWTFFRTTRPRRSAPSSTSVRWRRSTSFTHGSSIHSLTRKCHTGNPDWPRIESAIDLGRAGPAEKGGLVGSRRCTYHLRELQRARVSKPRDSQAGRLRARCRNGPLNHGADDPCPRSQPRRCARRSLLVLHRPRIGRPSVHRMETPSPAPPGHVALRSRLPNRLRTLFRRRCLDSRRSRLALAFAQTSGANFLTPAALRAVRARVASPERHQRQSRRVDLLSSMPLCFNLFGDLAEEPEKLARAVSTWWPDAPAGPVTLRFEHSPGRSEPLYLGNKSAFDAAFDIGGEVGPRAVVGVETKYHEHAKAESVPRSRTRSPATPRSPSAPVSSWMTGDPG